MKPGPRDVLRAIDDVIARGGPNVPELPTRRDIRPRRDRQLPLPLKDVQNERSKMYRVR